MTTTIQPKTVILDINGVLIRSNIARALPCYLEEKAQTDPLTRYNRFRGDRLQPLSHLSIQIKTRMVMSRKYRISKGFVYAGY